MPDREVAAVLNDNPQNCTRVVIVNVEVEAPAGELRPYKSNVRMKMKRIMNQLGWNPRTGYTCCIFWKRSDAVGWDPNDELRIVFQQLRNKYSVGYPNVVINMFWAVLKPVNDQDPPGLDAVWRLFAEGE
jgi:hypothetical protein